MHRYLRRHWPRFASDHDDVVLEAHERWKKQANYKPLVFARQVMRERNRKEANRSRIRKQSREDIEMRSVGHAGGGALDVRKFKKHEEAALKDLVIEFCEERFRLAWGKSWDPSRGWPRAWSASRARTLREFFQKLEADGPDHITAERDARKKLAELRGRQRLSEHPPVIGGRAVETLWLVRKLIDERGSSMLPSHLDSSDLRRFVARIRTNAALQVQLGCTRRPRSEAPRSKPNPRWITQPNVDEMTTIALLAGWWPTISRWPADGITVKNLVNRRMRPTVEAAIRDAK